MVSGLTFCQNFDKSKASKFCRQTLDIQIFLCEKSALQIAELQLYLMQLMSLIIDSNCLCLFFPTTGLLILQLQKLPKIHPYPHLSHFLPPDFIQQPSQWAPPMVAPEPCHDMPRDLWRSAFPHQSTPHRQDESHKF